jgi:hypothetical protein
VRHADPWVVRHDLVVKRQDSLVLRLHPAHLGKGEMSLWTLIT